MKGWIVKWQRALVTPFLNATALEAVPLQLAATVFTGRKKKKQYDLRTSYTHKKGNNISTINLLFKHWWSYKSPWWFFSKWKPLQAFKKFTNVSKKATQVVLSIRNNKIPALWFRARAGNQRGPRVGPINTSGNLPTTRRILSTNSGFCPIGSGDLWTKNIYLKCKRS